MPSFARLFPALISGFHGVAVVLYLCHSGVTVVLQWYHSGVTVVLQMCSIPCMCHVKALAPGAVRVECLNAALMLTLNARVDWRTVLCVWFQ
jgi:uncharacterized membrane protein